MLSNNNKNILVNKCKRLLKDASFTLAEAFDSKEFFLIFIKSVMLDIGNDQKSRTVLIISLSYSAASGGNVGVLHYLDQKSDFDWVLQDGSHAPYVVLIRPKDFTM